MNAPQARVFNTGLKMKLSLSVAGSCEVPYDNPTFAVNWIGIYGNAEDHEI
jgi:hypothetical protein